MCLIKGFIEYFRFLEDIGFIWKDHEVFGGKSQKNLNPNTWVEFLF